MSGAEIRRQPFAWPTAWRERRDARRQLLDKVRTRRRLAMQSRAKDMAVPRRNLGEVQRISHPMIAIIGDEDPTGEGGQERG